MANGLLGFIATPHQGNELVAGAEFCLDNGCFSAKWDADHWWAWLQEQPRTARFAVAPDVVADWPATLALFEQWEPRMYEAGFRVAIVAQDGCVPEEIPFDRVDAVFIGGSTEWKLSPASVAVIRAAKELGVWVHVGRVNSLRRLRWAAAHGADSADGTFLTFGPDVNLRRLLRWLREVNTQTTLDFGGAA